MDRRQPGAPRPRPLDHGDPRTPAAWQHRNINYQQQYNFYNERFGINQQGDMVTGGIPAVTGTDSYAEQTAMQGAARNQQYRPQARPVSSSTETSATSSTTAEQDTDSQMKYNGTLPFHPDLIPGTQATLGTLRSMQSTLSTWDGEPCPVHHVPVPIPVLVPPPPQYSLLALPPPPPPPPPILLPPMLRPRPLVLPADNPAPPEPLPVRDPKSSVSPLPPKERKQTNIHCCKGNIIVLWIILSIIFIGVLLGIVLRFVIA